MTSLAASSGVFGGGFDSLHASTNFLYLHIFVKIKTVKEKLKYIIKPIHRSLFLILA